VVAKGTQGQRDDHGELLPPHLEHVHPYCWGCVCDDIIFAFSFSFFSAINSAISFLHLAHDPHAVPKNASSTSHFTIHKSLPNVD